MKALAKDPMEHRNDKTVLATYSGGDLTAARLALVLLSALFLSWRQARRASA